MHQSLPIARLGPCGWRKAIGAATLVALISLLWLHPARAQGLIRDPDIEFSLKQLAAPILRQAGLSASNVDILLIDDRNLNAFVVDRNHIFIHTGLIERMSTPAMLQAVIAHEAAHIANGHIARRTINFRNARTAAGLGSILAAAAAMAVGRGDAAGAVAAGAQNSAMRRFFVHTRAEESAADQSGLRYLKAAGVDPNGMLEVLDIFRGQDLLVRGRQDAYARTHPLSQDRYRVVQRLAQAHTTNPGEDQKARYWYARAKGKLQAFKRSPKWTLARAGESGFADIKAMRQAVAWHRRSNLRKSLPLIDKAIAMRPKDPYYWELKGQILMESRKFAAATNAYGQAAALAPQNALILGAYGRALLAQGQTKAALDRLELSRTRDGRDVRVLRDLAAAYAKSGNRGMASSVTAERYAMLGRMKDAALHAQRAIDTLPAGSTGARRAQDVLTAANRALKNAKK